MVLELIGVFVFNMILHHFVNRSILKIINNRNKIIFNKVICKYIKLIFIADTNR